MAPKFQHDCDSCEFLGQFFGHDVYACKNPSRSVIARYGSDGTEYTSFPACEWKAQLLNDSNLWHIGDERKTFKQIVFSGSEMEAWQAVVAAMAVRGLETLV